MVVHPAEQDFEERDLINVALQDIIDESLKQIPAKILTSAYLYLHPESSQANLATDVFGMPPQSFSRLLARQNSTFSEDQRAAVEGLIGNTHFAEFAKCAKILSDYSSAIYFLRIRKATTPIIEEYLDQIFPNETFNFVHTLSKYSIMYRSADESRSVGFSFFWPEEKLQVFPLKDDSPSLDSKLLYKPVFGCTSSPKQFEDFVKVIIRTKDNQDTETTITNAMLFDENWSRILKVF